MKAGKVTIWPRSHASEIAKCSGTSPYGHLTSKSTSQLQSPWLSPKTVFHRANNPL